MNELKEKISAVFGLARTQLANLQPDNEQGMIQMINLKSQLFEELDKVPTKKKPD